MRWQLVAHRCLASCLSFYSCTLSMSAIAAGHTAAKARKPQSNRAMSPRYSATSRLHRAIQTCPHLLVAFRSRPSTCPSTPLHPLLVAIRTSIWIVHAILGLLMGRGAVITRDHGPRRPRPRGDTTRSVDRRHQPYRKLFYRCGGRTMSYILMTVTCDQLGKGFCIVIVRYSYRCCYRGA